MYRGQLPTACCRHVQMRENLSALKASLLGAGFASRSGEDVRGVSTSTLLVTGADSPALVRHLTDRLQELPSNTERAEIPDASHLMHEQNQAALNNAILTFLAVHPTPTATTTPA
jgi:pimeloyl-ACP methyl ester carboxylesterase